MNVIITTFVNPFSFFCLKEEDGKGINFLQNPIEPVNTYTNKINFPDVTHGQYVAVLWQNKWTRGLVTTESQFLIWLIDYGIYVRPDNKTVYVNLSPAHKKYPSKIFEASIHGVVPVDKALSEECKIQNKITHTWNVGSIEKAQSLIANATKLLFVPVALLSTKHNEVVLGDLYLEYNQSGYVNIIDEMEMWPVFLEKNKAAYLDGLSSHYTTRRKHRACLLKPSIADSGLPTMSFETRYSDYCAICKAVPQLEVKEYNNDLEDGSTVVEYGGKSKDNLYKLTPEEIEKYSNMNVEVCGREYNVLNVLINKIRDLNMCEMYKDHDLKSIGRATRRTSRNT